MTLIKSISGIRGTIGGRPGDNLTPLDIVKFTTAYVRFLGERKQGRLRIVVGRDARLSGEMVGDLIEGALLGCGADVVNVGLCTTPGVELAVTAHEADGGIIITASHNPRQWNALKLLDADGEKERAALLCALEEHRLDDVDRALLRRIVEKVLVREGPRLEVVMR